MNNHLQAALAEWQKKQQSLQSQATTAEKKQVAKRKSAPKAAPVRGSKAPATATLPATSPITKQNWKTAKVPAPTAAIPISKQLKDVVDHLESTRQRLSAQQLQDALHHDVTGNEELRHQLQLNAKITIHADGQYEYKPSHELQNADEVLNLLMRHPQGLVLGQIKDAYKGVTDDVKKLKEQGKVWCIYNVEKRDDVLFPQDAKPLITLSQDLVDFWHSTKVPEDPARVAEDLQKANLPVAARKVARKRISMLPRERKRTKRAVNMATATNQHMPELFAGAMPSQID